MTTYDIHEVAFFYLLMLFFCVYWNSVVLLRDNSLRLVQLTFLLVNSLQTVPFLASFEVLLLFGLQIFWLRTYLMKVIPEIFYQQDEVNIYHNIVDKWTKLCGYVKDLQF